MSIPRRIRRASARKTAPAEPTGHTHGQWVTMGKLPVGALEVTFTCGHLLRIAGDTPEEVHATYNAQPDGLCPNCEGKRFGKMVTGWMTIPGEEYGLPGEVLYPHNMPCPCCANVAGRDVEATPADARVQPATDPE